MGVPLLGVEAVILRRNCLRQNNLCHVCPPPIMVARLRDVNMVLLDEVMFTFNKGHAPQGTRAFK